VTSGSQQALDVIGKVFLNPGDRILVEAPTHAGALQAWQSYQAEYVEVPVDAEGLQIDLLRSGPPEWAEIALRPPEFPQSHRGDPLAGTAPAAHGPGGPVWDAYHRGRSLRTITVCRGALSR
jgi:DNA-binding transcriptional MocR family regulator